MQCPCAILSTVACPDLPYYSILSNKRHDIRKINFIERNVCVLLFSATFVCNVLIPRICERDIIKNVYWYACKVPVILSYK